MTKEEFIRLWATQFSASYMAVRYDDYCIRRWYKKPDDSTPDAVYRAINVEDAVFMAEIAWEKFCDLEHKYFKDHLPDTPST